LPSLTSSPALSSSSSSLARWSSSPRLPGSTTWRRGPSPRRMNKGPSPHRHHTRREGVGLLPPPPKLHLAVTGGCYQKATTPPSLEGVRLREKERARV
jgi:hypothetical protein